MKPKHIKITLAFVGVVAVIALIAAVANPAKMGMFFSTDGSGNPGKWAAFTGTGAAYTGSVQPAGLFTSIDGSGNPGTWTPVTANTFASGATAPKIICRQTTSIANTGNTGLNLVYSCTIPANTLGLNSKIEVKGLSQAGGANTGNTSPLLRFGSTNSGSDPTVWTDNGQGANVSELVYISIVERNSASAQIAQGWGWRNTNQVFNAPVTSSFSNAAPMYVTFWMQNGAAGDTTSLLTFDATLWP
jgi:hypothetical protein